jgi:hypothetical protein
MDTTTGPGPHGDRRDERRPGPDEEEGIGGGPSTGADRAG